MAQVLLTRRQCQDNDLPTICAKCGEPDTTRVRKDFVWSPPTVWIGFILCGFPGLLIAYLITRKKMEVRVPLCEKHVGDWGRVSLFAWVSIIGSVLVFVAGLVFAGNKPTEGLGNAVAVIGGIAFFAALITTAVWNTFLIRPNKITEDDILLTGLNPEFADEARDLRDRRDDERRRSRRYNDEDGDDDRPRRPSRYEDDADDDRPRRRDRD